MFAFYKTMEGPVKQNSLFLLTIIISSIQASSFEKKSSSWDVCDLHTSPTHAFLSEKSNSGVLNHNTVELDVLQKDVAKQETPPPSLFNPQHRQQPCAFTQSAKTIHVPSSYSACGVNIPKKLEAPKIITLNEHKKVRAEQVEPTENRSTFPDLLLDLLADLFPNDPPDTAEEHKYF